MCVHVVNKYKHGNIGIYIGRGSPFGNPYKMAGEASRDQVCDQYEGYFKKKVETDPGFKIQLDVLVAKARKEDVRLVCFCAPKRCHGETIKRYIEYQLKQLGEKEMFRICIAGSRGFDDYPLMEKVVCQFAKDAHLENGQVTIVSGTARGADMLGEQLAKDYSLHLERYPADWDNQGKRAGYMRNEQMAEISNAAIIFWDGESKGTGHMIEICKRRDIPVWVIEYEPRVTTYNWNEPEDKPPW
ncbi:MAG: DUF4326 domain-containing protein [Neptuniibacter sp.]